MTKARELREKSASIRFEAIFSMKFSIERQFYWMRNETYSIYHWYCHYEKIKFYKEDTNEILFEKTLNVENDNSPG